MSHKHLSKQCSVHAQGDAKAQICSFCENESTDLLVVTNTLRGRFKKALSPMGGVSSQLALDAPCPVLVLPTQASSKPPLAACACHCSTLSHDIARL